MQFTSIVLLLLSATSELMAFPSADPNPAYVELYREKTSNGSLIYLGPPEGSKMVRKADPNPAYVELYREKASNGSLIYLGPPEGSKMVREEIPRLEERGVCQKTQSITCDDDHTARNSLCDNLVADLFANPTISVGQSPRQICYLGGEDGKDSYCCVSWNKVVQSLTKGDLSIPTNSIMRQCTVNGISGKLNNIALEGVCATICLSNRGTKCA